MKLVTPIIKCPYCGAEYLPCEIFMPGDMLDRSKIIDKNSKGIIEHVEGKEADLEESYICDFCDKEFTVTASVVYTSHKEDSEEEYVTKL